MAPLLRRRLVCFYCGSRSNQSHSASLRQWQCSGCQAVNYLDENGEITDPPASDDASSVRYARRIERPVSPVAAFPDESLFCSTCVKNQHLFTQTLANYLPPPTDPRYPTFEAKYPQYRKSLEERYPQVCEQCVPKVHERLRATNYAFKTDILRHMMDNTRESRFSGYDWSWKNWSHAVVLLAGTCWFAALAGQVVWHTFGALSIPTNYSPEARDEKLAFTGCIEQSLKSGQMEQGCVALMYPYGAWALVLGLFSIWWNPCLSARYYGKGGRMTGLSEFYKLQIFLNTVRIAAWFVLDTDRGFLIDYSSIKAIHAVLLVINLVLSFSTYRAAGLKDFRLSLLESPPPLVAGKQYSSIPASSQEPHQTPSRSQRLQPAQVFPVDRLAPAPQRDESLPYQAPTPPPEDEDEMDWTPAKAAFIPAPSMHLHQPTPTRPQPSPFYGKLKPAPITPAQRLRNPPNQATFQKPFPKAQENFFNGMTKWSSRSKPDDLRDEDIESEFGDEDSVSVMDPVTPRRYNFAESKLHNLVPPGSVYTGLESLFTGMFSLSDEPPEIRAARQLHEDESKKSRDESLFGVGGLTWRRVVNVVVLFLASVARSTTQHNLFGGLIHRYKTLGSLGITTMVAGGCLLESLRRDKAHWQLSDILLFATEVAIPILLGRAMLSSSLRIGEVDIDFDTLAFYFVAAMLLQESLALISELKNRKLRFSARPLTPSPLQQQRTGTIPPRPPQSDHPLPSLVLVPKEQSPSPARAIPVTAAKAKPHPPAPQHRHSTRSKAKRESMASVGGLSGLSLGDEDGGDDGDDGFASWGAERSAATVARQTRSKVGMRPWQRGPI